MYTLWRVWSQAYTLVSITTVTVHILVCAHQCTKHLSSALANSYPLTNIYTRTHASTPGSTTRQRLRKEQMQMQEALHVSPVWPNRPYWAPLTLKRKNFRVIVRTSQLPGSHTPRHLPWLRPYKPEDSSPTASHTVVLTQNNSHSEYRLNSIHHVNNVSFICGCHVQVETPGQTASRAPRRPSQWSLPWL